MKFPGEVQEGYSKRFNPSSSSKKDTQPPTIFQISNKAETHEQKQKWQSELWL